MRKVTTFLRIGIVFCLLLCSCASEDDNDPVADPALLKKIEGDVMANHSEYTFYYDGRKLAKVVYQLETASTETMEMRRYDNYFYNNDLITEIRTYDQTDQLIAHKFFTYDENQRLQQEVALNLVNGSGLKSVFIYNDDDTVEVQRFYGDLNSQSIYADSDMIYLENGEIAQYDYFVGATLYSHKFEYDQGNNPMKNIIGMDKIKLCRYESSGWYGIAKNMKKITFYFSAQAEDAVEFDIFYDGEKYPVAAASTVHSPGPFSYRYEYY